MSEFTSLTFAALTLLLSAGAPYVAGYLARIYLHRIKKYEALAAVSSVTLSDLLIFLTFQGAMGEFNLDYLTMLLTGIPVLFVGYLLAGYLYESGCDRAEQNKSAEDDLAKSVGETYLKPFLQSYTELINASVLKHGKKLDSFEDRLNEINKNIEELSINVYQNNELYKRLAERVNATHGFTNLILEMLRDSLTSTADVSEGAGSRGESASDLDMRAKGKFARDTGEEIQAEVTGMIIEQWKGSGRVEPSFDKGRPDIALYDNYDRLRDVISVKSYSLDPTVKGVRNTRGYKVAVAFDVSRDAKAEAEFARRYGLYKIRLIVVNIKNRKVIFDGHVGIDDKITLRDYGRTLGDRGSSGVTE